MRRGRYDFFIRSNCISYWSNLPNRFSSTSYIFGGYVYKQKCICTSQTISLQFVKGDCLPENICSECIRHICRAYTFSQQCILSDKKLRLQRNQAEFDNIQLEIIEAERLESLQAISSESETDIVKKKSCENEKSGENEVQNASEEFKVVDGCSTECSSLKDENLKQYECLECSKKFTKKCHLTVHVKTHLKRKGKYKCEVCGLLFRYSYLLNQHKYKHTEEKPFPCTECSKGKYKINCQFLEVHALNTHFLNFYLIHF